MASKTAKPRRAKLPDAARENGVSVKTLRRRISDGSLTGYRLGARIILVDLDELEDLLYRIPSAGDAA